MEHLKDANSDYGLYSCSFYQLDNGNLQVSINGESLGEASDWSISYALFTSDPPNINNYIDVNSITIEISSSDWEKYSNIAIYMYSEYLEQGDNLITNLPEKSYPDTPENSYMIVFSGINGNETKRWTLGYNGEIICPDPGTYEGYTFSGYYYSHYNDTLYHVEDIVKVSDIVRSDTENLTLNFNIQWESTVSRNLSIYTSNGWVLGDPYYWDGTSWIKCNINTL